ncbi:MAG TPA: ABC transporter permease [Gemmatimonadaceae bacterium]|nr:ABC transporter permease [Gemmatimonadaceae bacterium]
MFLSDIRYSLRSLLRTPSFTAITVLTLALGIGSATAIFSVVQGVLLAPLPYPGAERMVQVWQVNKQGGRAAFADPNFADVKERVPALAFMAQYQAGVFSVTGGAEPIRAVVSSISRDFFDVMGVRPAMGREFAPDEQQEGGAGAVIVSHGFWRNSLGADPRFADRTLTFNDRVHAVVGVMPPGFEFPMGAELWMPREVAGPNPSRTAHNWRVVGRLAQGASVQQAQAQASAVAGELAQRFGDDIWMIDAAVVPLREEMVGRVRAGLMLLFGAAALLLLIAGANVVNLLLARATAREGELALRLALGADRGRLTKLFVAESLVLALAGGVLGVLIATWGVTALLALEPGNLPRLDEVGVNGWVLGFAIALSLVTALALGLAVVARAMNAARSHSLVSGRRTGGGSASTGRVRGALVAAQVALTVVLLVGATLLGRSFVRLMEVDPGFRTDGALLMTVSHPFPATPEDEARLTSFHGELLDRLSRLPGISRVGAANDLPMGGNDPNGTFGILTSVEEMRELADMEALRRFMSDPSRLGEAAYRVATPGYFAALGIPLQAGRLFDERDVRGAPHVALISETLAHRRWPDENPIGKVLQFGNMDGDLTPMTIVGVVGDVREYGLEAGAEAIVYGNALQRSRAASTLTIVMTGDADPRATTTAARGIVREMRPDVPPTFATMESRLSRSVAPRRFSLILLGAFASAALLLALMGIYGVTAYAVAQRTQEIGIRIALGARGQGVVRMMVARSIMTALLGLAIGVAGAVAVTRVLTSQLYGVSALDPVTFALVAAVLVSAAAVSSWFPARRASRVDPAVALRAE